MLIIDKDKHAIDESGDKDITPLQAQVMGEMDERRSEVVGKMKFDRGVGSSIGVGLRPGVTKRMVDGVWVNTRLGDHIDAVKNRKK